MEELVCGTLTCEERHRQMTNWKVFPQVLWKPSGKESVLQYVIQSRSNAETGNLAPTFYFLMAKSILFSPVTKMSEDFAIA